MTSEVSDALCNFYVFTASFTTSYHFEHYATKHCFFKMTRQVKNSISGPLYSYSVTFCCAELKIHSTLGKFTCLRGMRFMSVNNSDAYICGILFDKTNRYMHPIESITLGESHPSGFPSISKAVTRNYTTCVLPSLLCGHPVLKSKENVSFHKFPLQCKCRDNVQDTENKIR